ncbi:MULTISPECIES: hypothetical protein [Burkholderia]|jgi:hypothetical protein|uniref:Uncharacterized protein n=3 Tax=Burkholderia contaminans TaxID=488447 RepID=A0A250LDH5_9BURK|nr:MULTISPECIES: hypothetical protein [Burkholderia]UTP23388.1 hypothetical protein NMB33_06450 [Burkholderia sp. FXe9]MBA9832071.1 hypothetical protein [Burkholderia contaminans]MBA9839357.1 hypothetical protein [Burkholderia contaminans]MBA9906844.1 hypothetical protein [Burkholderia contaminans]MBH9690816.1 hypothetical protein [Burkholderia contaminans]
MPVDTVQYFHGESTMSLSHLIQKHKKDLEEQKSVDWSARLERWKSELSGLFALIHHALIDAGLDSDDVSYEQKTIREDFIGSYSVERMTVHLGAATVMFDPIATLIIGGFGRVDVTSLTNRVRLIAIDASEEEGEDTPVSSRKWQWIVTDPNRPLHFEEFSEVKIEYLFDTVLKKHGDA